MKKRGLDCAYGTKHVREYSTPHGPKIRDCTHWTMTLNDLAALTTLTGREGGAGAERAILPYVGYLQLISTLKIGAECCQLCQYNKLTKPSLKKVKVVYVQEPPCGEFTTTECGFNYQLLAVITEVAQLGAPSCSQPHLLRTMASEMVDPIDWSHPPPYTGQYPLSSTYCTLQCGLQIIRLAAPSQPRICDFKMPDQRTAGVATEGIPNLS